MDPLEPLHFCCPVTLHIFHDPITIFPEGHTFERSVIDQLPRQAGNKCRNPLTRRLFSPIHDVAPNLSLLDAIIAWKATHNLQELKQEVEPQQYLEVSMVATEEADVNPISSLLVFMHAAYAFCQLQQAHEQPNMLVSVLPVEPVFVTLRMFQRDQTYIEFPVVRLIDNLGHCRFVIQNHAYTGTRGTSPKAVNCSGRSGRSVLAQKDIQLYIRRLSGVSINIKSPCFRLFWLLFVCRFQYQTNVRPQTLTISKRGRVFKADETSIDTRYCINQFLCNL